MAVILQAGRAARWAESVWYGSSPLALLLAPPAWLFGLAVRARRALYRRRLLPTRELAVPVVVVGNITVGGTGKTPVVEWLVRALASAGRRPGIVSRGYGGRPQRTPRQVTADADPAQCGDEAVLLARRTGVPVRVSPDRVAAAQALLADGVDVIVSDDGLQHYRLGRALEVIVLDAERGLGNGRLLPAGPLREPASRLATADLVLWNGAMQPPSGHGFRLVPGEPVDLLTGQRQPLAALGSRPVWIVAGIGNPGRFVAQLAAAGIRGELVPVPDHGVVDLHALVARAERPILMTEKDAVKYPSPPPGAWYVPVTVEMSPSAEAALRSALSRLPG